MNAIRKSLSRSRSASERGQSLVEFALVAPLFFLALVGMLDFGRFVAATETVNSSAREGARFGSAIADSESVIPQYVDCDGIIAAATGVVGVIPVTTANVTISYDEGPSTATYQSCPAGGPVPSGATVTSGDRILVTVSADLDLLTPVISNFFGGTVTITSTDRRSIFKG